MPGEMPEPRPRETNFLKSPPAGLARRIRFEHSQVAHCLYFGHLSVFRTEMDVREGGASAFLRGHI